VSGIDYPLIQKALQRIDADFSPADLHGQLCGLACADPELTVEHWLAQSLPELVSACAGGDALARESAAQLRQFYEETEQAMQDRQLGFQLCLPSDDAPLSQRIEELSRWCEGFLLGLAMAGIKDFKSLPGDLPELMQDLVEISRASSYEAGEGEDDQDAYMELVEYIRMGALLARVELHHLHEAQHGQPSIH